jgi:hypothetical protein
MKNIILSVAILLLGFCASGQALIGKTKADVREYFYSGSTHPTFSYSEFSDGTLMTVVNDFYKAYVWIDYDSGRCTEYFIMPSSESYETSYRAALTRNQIQLSTNKWITTDYKISVEYKWSDDMKDFIFLIKSLE